MFALDGLTRVFGLVSDAVQMFSAVHDIRQRRIGNVRPGHFPLSPVSNGGGSASPFRPLNDLDISRILDNSSPMTRTTSFLETLYPGIPPAALRTMPPFNSFPPPSPRLLRGDWKTV